MLRRLSGRMGTRRVAMVGFFVALTTASIAFVFSQQPGRRMHTTIQAGQLRPVQSNQPPPSKSRSTIAIEDGSRIIRSNGIPDHPVGAFPNRGNPNSIRSQSYDYHVPASPQINEKVTPISGIFGIATNGVPFDPGAAEFYLGQMGSPWQYEPLSGAIALGIDSSNAHVQPNGAYHYHGLPHELLKQSQVSEKKHSPIIGWAADGFPIYSQFGFRDPTDPNSPSVELHSSYQLKEGFRPGHGKSNSREPGGKYDGTFVADYEFIPNAGDLDECNGRQCVTPDFPEGTYAYFLTEEWPVIPRSFRGQPSEEFMRRGMGRPGFGPPGFGPPGSGRPGFGPPGRRPPGRGRPGF